MVTSLNDSRRSKLYRAERRLEHELGRELHPLTTPVAAEDVQDLVNRAAAAMGLERAPRVRKHKRGTRIATAWTAQALIKLPVNQAGEWDTWGRQPIVILHELAHCAIHWRLPGHGREFVAAFKRVLTWFLEEEHGRPGDPALARLDELLDACGCRDHVTAKERSQIRFQLRHADHVWIVLADGSTESFFQTNPRHVFDEDRDVVVLEGAGRQDADVPARTIAVDEIRYAVSRRASAS